MYTADTNDAYEPEEQSSNLFGCWKSVSKLIFAAVTAL